MQGWIDELTRLRMTQSTATTFFAFAALLLAGLGLYGILAYTLSLRRREIGIRLALGASGMDILMNFNRNPLLASLSGLGIGTGLGLVMTRWMEPLLFGVKPSDPIGFVVSIVAVGAICLLACFEPTRQALNVPPAEALRQG